MGDAPDAEPRFRRGSVVRGKYRVERVLGEGGMGIVLLATHLKLDQRVALKVLAPSVERRAHVHARFAREARAVSKLRNEHVVRVLDVDETEDGLPFLVMEFLVGADLEVVVRRDGPLAPEKAADYVLQACEGIAEAHAVGIVHRDLKPANLFLAKTEDDREIVKVLDFGIAKATENAEDLSLTATSGVVGSPLYMSPEQLKGSRDVDVRTDVWSLGVVLYQLATGKLPFEATSATTLAALIASEPPIPIGAARRGLPEAYVDAVERCLKKDRSERFANVVELARAIAEVAEGATGSAERVSRVSRAAAARQLSLAQTAPEDEDGVAPTAASTDRPARVTAALTGEDNEPREESAEREAGRDQPVVGQRTDYGSEVVRKASLAPPKHSRRRVVALSVAAVSAVAVAVFVRGRVPAEHIASPPDQTPAAAVAPPDPSRPVGTLASTGPIMATSAATAMTTPDAGPPESARPVVSPRPLASAVGTPRLPARPAAGKATVTPSSPTASPFDIDLK